MVYPLCLKKFFTLFKAMSVKEICMAFDEKSINIYAVDHLKKSYIKVLINCDKINHYYCEGSINIYLNPKNMENIIQILDKNYITIAFMLEKISKRSTLHIIYKNDMKIDEHREIDLIQSTNISYDIDYTDINYPIKFVLPSKYFKKFIGDTSTFSNTLVISKVGNHPLTFIHTSRDRTIKSKHIVQSPESVKLVSLVSDDEIFSSSIQIDYIKPLSSSMISEFISISLDIHKNMIFKMEIDNKTIEIAVNIETIKLN